MKRYVVMAGLRYYPQEGLGDFVGAFDSQEEARNAESDAVAALSGDTYDDFVWSVVYDIEGDSPKEVCK